MSDQLQLERIDSVAWVTINRPESRNALSKAINLELIAVVGEIGDDPEVRAAVITGAGSKAFCAGADLKERKGVTAEETGPYVDAIGGAINAWGNLRLPTIAALNGYAFGGGVELALACDFRIAVESAVFALTEVRLGILPGAGGTQRLPRLVGEARAKELILLGRRVTAQRAAEIGLVNEVVAVGELSHAVDALLVELEGCAPLSVAKAKEAIEAGRSVPLAEGLVIERACYDVTLFSDDRNEGLAAFAEKRPPRYRGR